MDHCMIKSINVNKMWKLFGGCFMFLDLFRACRWTVTVALLNDTDLPKS